jgi:hypothetical protein
VNLNEGLVICGVIPLLLLLLTVALKVWREVKVVIWLVRVRVRVLVRVIGIESTMRVSTLRIATLRVASARNLQLLVRYTLIISQSHKILILIIVVSHHVNVL